MRKIIALFRKLQDLYLISTSSFFDKNWYLEKNPDIAKAGVNPYLHYLRHGGFEGRNPSPKFDSSWYLDTYKDVKNRGLNPLIHYLRYGKKEGRSIRSKTKLISYAGEKWLPPPHFLIIGAQKAGTTALFRILPQHPQIVAPKTKEMHFFATDTNEYGDFASYQKMFPSSQSLQPYKLTFEASPSYLYHPESPRRIYEYSDKTRIIAILRNPIERAFSAWNMYHRFQHFSPSHPYSSLADPRSFEDAVMSELATVNETSWKSNRIAYVKRGVYVEQLERYYYYFPQKQVMILNYAELLKSPKSVLEKVALFLQVDDKFDFDVIQSNVSTYEAVMSPKMRDILAFFYAPYNQKLFELIGREFDWG